MSQNQDTPKDIERALHATLAHTEGEFPEGRLNEHDAGAVTLAVGVERDGQGEPVVVLRFPKPVQWFGVPPAQAMELAVSLMKHARRCGHHEPLVFRVGEPRPLPDGEAP